MDKKVSKEESEKKIVTLSGYLGQDSITKTVNTEKGEKQVATFSVADNSNKDAVKWNNVQLWDKQIPKEPLKKGDHVELQGYYKSFDTANGKKEEFVATKLISHKQKEEKAQAEKKTETIKGNLGQNPEFKKVGDKDVAAFSIGYKNEKEETAWQNIQVWQENIEKNKVYALKKGDFVELKGHYGKEYQTKNNETKRDFILEESRVLKHAEKQEEKKSKGMKI